MTPGKFRDDISNGSGVIVFDRQTNLLTDRQTESQTDTTGTENNTTLVTLRCAGGGPWTDCGA